MTLELKILTICTIEQIEQIKETLIKIQFLEKEIIPLKENKSRKEIYYLA